MFSYLSFKQTKNTEDNAKEKAEIVPLGAQLII